MAAERTTSGSELSRRAMFRAVAVGGLAVPMVAACGSDGDGAGPDASASSGSAVPSLAAAVADLPVGGGKIFADQLVVVTQPAEGEFKAFTATCTHQGCAVTSISDGQIVCPCHGSHFSIEDGSVLSGPAPKPLVEYPVAVEGDQVVVG